MVVGAGDSNLRALEEWTVLFNHWASPPAPRNPACISYLHVRRGVFALVCACHAHVTGQSVGDGCLLLCSQAWRPVPSPA